MKALILFFILSLVACGNDDSKGSNPAPTQTPTATDTTALEGVPGAQGPKGDVGPQGPKGDKGDKGDAGRPVDKNEWVDPATGDLWFYGPLQAFDAKACDGNGYSLPTVAQLTVARAHGLFIAATNGEGDAWAADQTQFLAVVPSSLAGRATHGLYCIKVK